MIVTGIDHYAIAASAEVVEECVAFYTTVLNLRIGFRPPHAGPGFWLYSGDKALVHLRIIDSEEPCSPDHCHHISFSCVNLPVTIKRLEDLGISYTTTHLEELDQFLVMVSDPAGHLVELTFSCENLSQR